MARENVTKTLDQLEMKRAVEHAMTLFGKLREFERLAQDARGGELDAADEAALATGLRLLVQLIAPMAPHVAEELWALSGEQSMLATLPWPQPVARTSPPRRGGEQQADASAIRLPR